MCRGAYRPQDRAGVADSQEYAGSVHVVPITSLV